MHRGIQRQRLVRATSFCVFEVILSVTFQLFGMQKTWSNHSSMGCGVRPHSPVTLSRKEKQACTTQAKPSPTLLLCVFPTRLLLYIVVVFSLLEYVFSMC